MYQIIRQDIPLGWEYAGSTEVDVDIFVMFLVEIMKMFMLFFSCTVEYNVIFHFVFLQVVEWQVMEIFKCLRKTDNVFMFMCPVEVD